MQRLSDTIRRLAKSYFALHRLAGSARPSVRQGLASIAGGNREKSVQKARMKNLFPDSWHASSAYTADRQGRNRLRQLTPSRALCVLLTLQCLAVFASADVTPQELQKWVNNSVLIFQGKVVDVGTKVQGNPNANQLTVEVDDVLLKNDVAVHNFGSLERKNVTVTNPLLLAPGLRKNESAVFFVNPLFYDKDIVLTATAIADVQSGADLPARISEAIETKAKNSASEAERSADTIVTGVVEEIRVLPDAKLKDLQKTDNGYDIYSEHSPRWREALIRVQITKRGPADKKLLVVFPSTEDRAWARSPKFIVGQSGTWLLHGFTHGAIQLSSNRARILLAQETVDGVRLKVYTALRPEDFRPNDSFEEKRH